jgi:hypothetical protein
MDPCREISQTAFEARRDEEKKTGSQGKTESATRELSSYVVKLNRFLVQRCVRSASPDCRAQVSSNRSDTELFETAEVE